MGRLRVRPQIDIFNALNNNAITQVNTNYGPSLLQPQSVLNPRLLRMNVRISFLARACGKIDVQRRDRRGR